MTGAATAATAVARTLQAYGVTHVFGMKDPIHVYAALRPVGIRAITVRDEKHGAIMAHGFAKATNRPGVCTAMCGPGATNLITGLLEAQKSSVPIVAFVLDIGAAQRGRHAASELDHFAALGPFAKWIGRIDVPNRAAEITRYAFRVATSGRPGPVVVLCPRDVMEEPNDEEVWADPGFDRFPSIRSRASDESVLAAAHLLLGAERPVIVAGGGVLHSQASEEVVALAQILNAPIATTMNGRGAVADAHPLAAGVLGTSTGGRLGRGRIANEVLAGADAVLIVGSRNGQICSCDWTLPRPGTRVAHIDIDPAEIGRNHRVEVTLVGDARGTLRALIETCRSRHRGALDPKCAERLASMKVAWQQEIAPWFASQQVPIRPERLLHEISQHLESDALLVTDASYVVGWALSHIDTHGGGTPTISPRGTGGLGWGLPAAIGARMGAPGREVLCVTGDGGLGYVLAELETAARYRAKMTVVVFDNRTLAFQKHVEVKLLGEAWECDLLDVDYAALARTMHWEAERVLDPEEIGPALKRARATAGPYLIDVAIDPDAIAPIVGLAPEGARVASH